MKRLVMCRGPIKMKEPRLVLEKQKDLFFTGAHVDGLVRSNVITQASKHGKFFDQFVTLNVYLLHFKIQPAVVSLA